MSVHTHNLYISHIILLCAAVAKQRKKRIRLTRRNQQEHLRDITLQAAASAKKNTHRNIIEMGCKFSDILFKFFSLTTFFLLVVVVVVIREKRLRASSIESGTHAHAPMGSVHHRTQGFTNTRDSHAIISQSHPDIVFRVVHHIDSVAVVDTRFQLYAYVYAYLDSCILVIRNESTATKMKFMLDSALLLLLSWFRSSMMHRSVSFVSSLFSSQHHFPLLFIHSFSTSSKCMYCILVYMFI